MIILSKWFFLYDLEVYSWGWFKTKVGDPNLVFLDWCVNLIECISGWNLISREPLIYELVFSTSRTLANIITFCWGKNYDYSLYCFSLIMKVFYIWDEHRHEIYQIMLSCLSAYIVILLRASSVLVVYGVLKHKQSFIILFVIWSWSTWHGSLLKINYHCIRNNCLLIKKIVSNTRIEKQNGREKSTKITNFINQNTHDEQICIQKSTKNQGSKMKARKKQGVAIYC